SGSTHASRRPTERARGRRAPRDSQSSRTAKTAMAGSDRHRPAMRDARRWRIARSLRRTGIGARQLAGFEMQVPTHEFPGEPDIMGGDQHGRAEAVEPLE